MFRSHLLLGIGLFTLLARAAPLSCQNAAATADVVAAEFRRIAEDRGTASDEARAHRLFAAFEFARGPGRTQPMDTVVDASGERAMYRRLRPDWALTRWENAVAAVESIDRARLDARDGLAHDVVRSDAMRELAMTRAPRLYLPLSDREGLHLVIWFYGSEYWPTETVAGYEVRLAHLNGVALAVDEMTSGMQGAFAGGIAPPRGMLAGVADALAEAIVDDPLESGYLAKFLQFPPSIPVQEQARLRASAAPIYTGKIRPAYQRQLRYATEVYIPGATASIGVGALPGGAERYATIVRVRTRPADLSPAQLHQMALDDVARHASAIDSFRVAAGYPGSYRDFLDYLRTDDRFTFPDSAAYLRAARDIATRVDAKIFTLFEKVPRLPFGIDGVRAVGGGIYRAGSLEDARPGMVLLFVSGDRPGPSWRLPSLVLHEGVPGHHFAHASFLERDLRSFQRQGLYTAFDEGWGMYAESMGTALGVHDDDYAAAGYLMGSLWRAVRASLDTGIHGLGWTWDEAVEWALANSPHPQAQIESELRGIIGNPGSILAYKLGQWKFHELRALAERELGASFDGRAFNSALIENGAMPLDVLDAHMRAWVTQRAAAPH